MLSACLFTPLPSKATRRPLFKIKNIVHALKLFIIKSISHHMHVVSPSGSTLILLTSNKSSAFAIWQQLWSNIHTYFVPFTLYSSLHYPSFDSLYSKNSLACILIVGSVIIALHIPLLLMLYES